MKDLIKHVTSMNVEELVRKGEVVGRYKVGRERVDLTQIAFTMPETVCITVRIHKTSTAPDIQIQLIVKPVLYQNTKCYALGYRTPFQTQDWVVDESGAVVFGRAPFMITNTGRSNAIISLIDLASETSKRILESHKVLVGLRG